jgi:hypothetical protein
MLQKGKAKTIQQVEEVLIHVHHRFDVPTAYSESGDFSILGFPGSAYLTNIQIFILLAKNPVFISP